MPFANKTIRDKRRAQVAEQVRQGTPCIWCRQPIDLTLKYPDPMSFTAEHFIPTSKGGTDDLDNIVPAHSRCNLKRQDKDFSTDISFNSGSLKLRRNA